MKVTWPLGVLAVESPNAARPSIICPGIAGQAGQWANGRVLLPPSSSSSHASNNLPDPESLVPVSCHGSRIEVAVFWQ